MEITEHADWDDPLGEADATAVAEYLDLPTWEQALQQLVPAPTIEEVLSRPQVTKDALRARRTAIAQGLSNAALMEVLSRLERGDGECGWLKIHSFQPSEEAAPAFFEFKARCERGSQTAEAEEAAQHAADLSKAKSIMCERWRDGPVDAREWMADIIAKPGAARYADKVLKEWSTYVGAGDYLREMDGSVSSRSDPSRAATRAAVRRFVDEYSPGLPPPTSLKALLKMNFSSRWYKDRCFKEDWEKILAVLNWHPFWKQHEEAFVALFHAEERNGKEQAAINRAKGKAGAEKKARKKWIRFTQDFLTWTQRKRITAELIDNYPKQEGVTEADGREFLKTLLTARHDLSTYREMEETLRRVGIRLLQKHAEECSSVLFDGIIPEP